MLGWFVCPTVFMVTTGKAIGLKKTECDPGGVSLIVFTT